MAPMIDCPNVAPVVVDVARPMPSIMRDEDVDAYCTRLLAWLRHAVERTNGGTEQDIDAAYQAVKALPTSAPTAERINILLAIGEHYHYAAHAAAGLASVQEAVVLARALGDRPLLRKALNFLGIMLMETGDVPEATACYSEALSIAQTLGDAGAEAPVWNNLGLALQNAAQYADAIRCFERAAAIAAEFPCYADVQTSALTNIANCALHLHDVRAGIIAVRRAIELNREPKTATACHFRVIAESTYARLLLEIGETGHAAEHCELARLYAAKSPTARAEHCAAMTSGLVDVHAGATDIGLTRLKRSLEQARQQVRSEVRDALSACVAGYEKAGQPEVALEYLNELLQMNRQAKAAQLLLSHRQHLERIASRAADEAAASLDAVLHSSQQRLKAQIEERTFADGRALSLEQQAVAAELIEDASGKHCYRVGKLAELLARDIGVDEEVIARVKLAGRLHDIGKLVVPAELLRKRGKLSVGEMQLVQVHAEAGAEFLANANLPELQIAQEVARHSHERWDGSGYPARLAHDAIPLWARVVAVAETFDVLTHERPYKRAWPLDAALAELRRQSGAQLDPSLVARFCPLMISLARQHPDLDAFLAEDAEASTFLQARARIGDALSEWEAPTPTAGAGGIAPGHEEKERASDDLPRLPATPHDEATAEADVLVRLQTLDACFTADEDAAVCTDLLAALREAARAPAADAAALYAAACERLAQWPEATASAARVECLLLIAQHYYLAAKPAAALAPAQAAADLARRLPDRSLLRKALNFLGVMRMETGNLPEATVCYSEALSIAQTLGDAGAEAPVWNNLGLALQNAAQYADAIRCFERAIALAEGSISFGDVRMKSLSNIAGCALHLHDVRAGIIAVRRAIELNREPDTAADCLSRVIAESHYARLLLEIGETGHAAEHCELARVYAAKMPNARAAFAAEIAGGLVDVHAGATDVGLTRLKKSLEQARQQVRSEVRDALSACVAGYEKAGQPEVALEYLNELLQMNRQAKAAQLLLSHRQHLERIASRAADEAAASLDAVLHSSQQRLKAQIEERTFADGRALSLEQQAVAAELIEDASGKHCYRVGKLATQGPPAAPLSREERRHRVGILAALLGRDTQTGNLSEDAACFLDALSIAQALGDADGEAGAWFNLGAALQNAAQYADAIRCFERARDLAAGSAPSGQMHRQALSSIASCALHLHDVRAGIIAVRRAIELNREPKKATACHFRVIAESHYARLLLEIGETGHAAEHCELARVYAAKMPNARAAFAAEIAGGLVDVHAGATDVGLTRLKKSLEQARQQVRSEVRDALSACVAGYEAAGQPDVALVYLHELLALNKAAREAQVLMHHRQHVERLERAAGSIDTIDNTLAWHQGKLRGQLPERELMRNRILLLEQQSVAAELHDDTTGEHCYRVGRLASILGREIGLEDDVCFLIDLAARLHDIGKLVVPDELLRKRGALSPGELAIVQKHAEAGADILSKAQLPGLQIAQDIARYSHERWDGTGYPHGLAGEDIPLAARIVGLAETFDALTHMRPYRRAWSLEDALTEIERGAGSAFDPNLAPHFVRIVRDLASRHANIDDVLGERARSTPLAWARAAIARGLGTRRGAAAIQQGENPVQNASPPGKAGPSDDTQRAPSPANGQDIRRANDVQDPPQHRFEILLKHVQRAINEPDQGSSQLVKRAVAELSLVSDDHRNEAWVNCMLEAMRFHFLAAAGEEALAIGALALQAVWSLGSAHLRRKALNYYGSLLLDQGAVPEAMRTFVEAIDVSRSMARLDSEAPMWNNIGLCLSGLGLHSEATACFEKAVELAATSAEFARTAGAALVNVAGTALRTGDFARGIRSALRVLDLPRATDAVEHRHRDVEAHATLAELFLAVGQVGEAERHADAALRRAAASGHRRSSAAARLARALVDVQQGRRQDGMNALTALMNELRGALPFEMLAVLQACAAALHGNDLRAITELYLADAVAVTTAKRLDTIRQQQRLHELDLARRRSGGAIDVATRLEVLEMHAVAAELVEDPSGQHPYRVGRLAALLAAERGLDKGVCYSIEVAGLLADIGKAALPELLLSIRGRLTPQQRTIMERHAAHGAELLRSVGIDALALAEEAARHHHERWDGTGYPHRLRGRDIPLAARLVAVADAFDVLTHSRPYRPARPVDDALRELERMAGRELDPDLVRTFVDMMGRLLGTVQDLDAWLGARSSRSPLLKARARILHELGHTPEQWGDLPSARGHDPPHAQRGEDFLSAPRRERLVLLSQIVHDMKHPAAVHERAVHDVQAVLPQIAHATADLIRMLTEALSEGGTDDRIGVSRRQIVPAIERTQKEMLHLDFVLKQVRTAGYMNRELQWALRDIVDVLRYDAGGIMISNGGFALDQLQDELAKAHVEWAQSNQVELEIARTAVTVVSDRRQLSRLLTNLIVNAVRHSGARRVVVTTEVLAEGIRLAVTDNGRGIAPELLPEIFALRKTRAEGNAPVDARVSGIGLYVASISAERLGATLQVRSEPGIGTTFTLELPCFVQKSVPSITQAGLPPDLLHGKVIAMVDDYQPALQSLAASMEGLGAAVIARPDTLSFVHGVSTLPRSPDLLVVDYFVGDRTAGDLLPWLERFRYERVPVVVLTARPDDARVKQLPPWVQVMEKEEDGAGVVRRLALLACEPAPEVMP